MNQLLSRDEILARVFEMQLLTIRHIFSGNQQNMTNEFMVFLEFLSCIQLSQDDEEMLDAVQSTLVLISLAVEPNIDLEIEIEGGQPFDQWFNNLFVDVPKTGIKPVQLQKVSSLLRRDRDKSGIDQPACTICLVDYKKTERVRQLPCKHNFHDQCITTWLKHNTTCPLCVSTIEVPDLKELKQQPPRKCKRSREDAFNEEHEK